MNRARWFAVVVALQVAFLLGWAGFHEWSRASAAVILLETAPVDPRDLLRGDYMILGYKIGRVPRPPGSAGAGFGAPIWVSLRPNARFHEVAGASWTEPERPAVGEIVVQGRVTSRAADPVLRVEYGIEKYFVPEGKGQPRFREMVVEAIVTSSHRLAIKRLLIDGAAYP